VSCNELALTGSAPIRSADFPRWPQPVLAVEAAVCAVLRTGNWWQSGSGTAERLEQALADRFDVERAVCVMNGTVAIEIGLRALGIGPGDEVLVPSTTFVSTASAVAIVGATPVPIDVHATTLNMDAVAAEHAITDRTRAVIAVHLAGQPCDLEAIRELCDRRCLALVEDSAQAIGAEWNGARVGSAGDVTTLSFQAAKLVSGGEGGAVLVRADPTLARRVELLANCGRPRGSGSYDHVEIGTNARISELNAAVVLAGLPDYDELRTVRDDAVARLRREFDQRSLVDTAPSVTRHDHYMLLLRVPALLNARGVTNGTVAAALTAEGLPANILYPAWTTLPAFAAIVDERADRCPASLDATARGMWMHHRLLLDDDFPAQLRAAWERITTAPDALLAWQRDRR
jgi:3-amino-5-hydroxybenzoate synthase